MYFYRNLPKTNIYMYFYRNLPKNKHKYVFLQKYTEKQT